MTGPRFYFVTNDLPRAALELYCHPGNLPHWMAVVDNFDDWMKIPAGAKCMGLWYGSAGDVEGWRNAWSTRKERGDLIGITPEELEKIHAWAETARKAPDLKLLYGIEPEPAVVPSGGDALRPPQPEIDPQDRFPSPSAPTVSEPIKRSAKWT